MLCLFSVVFCSRGAPKTSHTHTASRVEHSDFRAIQLTTFLPSFLRAATAAASDRWDTATTSSCCSSHVRLESSRQQKDHLHQSILQSVSCLLPPIPSSPSSFALGCTWIGCSSLKDSCLNLNSSYRGQFSIGGVSDNSAVPLSQSVLFLFVVHTLTHTEKAANIRSHSAQRTHERRAPAPLRVNRA